MPIDGMFTCRKCGLRAFDLAGHKCEPQAGEPQLPPRPRASFERPTQPFEAEPFQGEAKAAVRRGRPPGPNPWKDREKAWRRDYMRRRREARGNV